MQARTAREFFMNIQLSMFKISGNSRRVNGLFGKRFDFRAY